MRRRWLWAVVGVVLLGGAAYLWRRASATPALSALTAETGSVGQGTITSKLTATGTVAAWSETVVRVGVGVTGTLQPFTWAPSQPVSAGEVLFRLVNPSLQAQYAADANQLAQAEVTLGQGQAALAALSPADPTIQASIDAVAEAARTLTQDQAQITADGTVTAPAAGTVASLQVAAGQPVSPGQTVATIDDVATLNAVVSVPATAISGVQVGQSATVFADNQQAVGTVSAVGVEPASTLRGIAAYPVTIAVANPGGWLPGMQAIGVIAGSAGAPQLLQGLGGELQASASVPATAAAAGTVTAVDVTDGAAVAAGAALVAISPADGAVQIQHDQSAYEQAKAALQTAVAGESLQAQTATSALELQQLRVQALQASVAEDRALLDGLTVRSPASGVISSVQAVAGQPVASGTPLLTIGDYHELLVSFPVDQLYADTLQVGQAAVVSTSAVPGKTYAASVYLMAPEGTDVNGVATFQATLAVPQPAGLKPGMAVDVSINLARDRNTLYVPLQALHTASGGGQFVVVVAAAGALRRVPVTVGVADSLDAAVRGDLHAGERVLLTSLGRLPGGGGSLDVQGAHLVRRRQPAARKGG